MGFSFAFANMLGPSASARAKNAVRAVRNGIMSSSSVVGGFSFTRRRSWQPDACSVGPAAVAGRRREPERRDHSREIAPDFHAAAIVDSGDELRPRHLGAGHDV